MDRRYRAFLLRCWRLGDEQRFEIAHIQSGDTIRAASLAEVLAWLDRHLATSPQDESAPPTTAPSDDTSATIGERR
jgi:hypothetical protein